jgi:hypothetical protein
MNKVVSRILTVLITIIMAFASVQTTWALHYCGGILRSITLAYGNPACCCGDKNENNIDHHSSDLQKINESCCSDYFVDIATDNFDITNFVIETIQHIANLFLLPDNSLKLNESENFPVSQYIFPPGGHAKYNADLLTLICIFRI